MQEVNANVSFIFKALSFVAHVYCLLFGFLTNEVVCSIAVDVPPNKCITAPKNGTVLCFVDLVSFPKSLVGQPVIVVVPSPDALLCLVSRPNVKTNILVGFH